MVLATSCLNRGWAADAAPNTPPELAADRSSRLDAILLPGGTNSTQFLLYTNASPDSARLFNTFDIEVRGEKLLAAPGGAGLKHWRGRTSANASAHHILIDGAGPELATTNGMTVLGQASGPDWRYLALDASAGYRDRLRQYERRILFVEPDIFVLYDHLAARKPATFQMLLHPSAAMRVDQAWGDLRLDLPSGGLTIHSPGQTERPATWAHVESAADESFPGTVTMGLSRTDKSLEFDVVTVFAIHASGSRKELAFKLLASDSAIGARIHRDGAPTLVGFCRNPAEKATLAGFDFTGPAGVYVFRPKQRSE